MLTVLAALLEVHVYVSIADMLARFLDTGYQKQLEFFQTLSFKCVLVFAFINCIICVVVWTNPGSALALIFLQVREIIFYDENLITNVLFLHDTFRLMFSWVER